MQTARCRLQTSDRRAPPPKKGHRNVFHWTILLKSQSCRQALADCTLQTADLRPQSTKRERSSKCISFADSPEQSTLQTSTCRLPACCRLQTSDRRAQKEKGHQNAFHSTILLKSRFFADQPLQTASFRLQT